MNKLSGLGETHRVYIKFVENVIYNSQCEIYGQTVHLDDVLTHKVKKINVIYCILITCVFLLVLRILGKKPFIGHRNKFVFHILYIDNKFSVYNH